MKNKTNGYIAVDFDGTLVHHTEYCRPEKMGKPVPLMVERVKGWLKEGKEVRIFTARVSRDNPDAAQNKREIEAWCEEHLGQKLKVQDYKNCQMIELWDDRAVGVIPNTGKRADGKP